MKLSRKNLLMTILGGSLALNVAFVAYHARAGTFRRLLLRADLVEGPADSSAYQAAMEARYRKLPDTPSGVVFAGDSLIHYGPWSEFYSDIHNRGIPGETSALLLGRLGEITLGKPRKLILLTGANDFAQRVPTRQLVRNYRSILEKVRADSPETEVTVIWMLPIDPSLPGGPRHDNPAILEGNRQLEALTRDFPKVRFLDLTSRLADDSGKLRREFTEDGLHLTIDGYLALREALQALMNDLDQG
jgi:lysophospholipase L1-like esterase